LGSSVLHRVGLYLLIASGVSLVLTVFWTMSMGAVDFPCSSGPFVDPGPNDTFAYCISAYPRNAYGGYVYSHGSSSKEKVSIPMGPFWHGSYVAEPHGEMVLLNGRELAPGDSYETTRWFQSVNPWLAVSADIIFANTGPFVLPSGREIPMLSGSIEEGWGFSPLGLIIGLAGYWLVWRYPSEPIDVK
jgi:hypothetical protein